MLFTSLSAVYIILTVYQCKLQYFNKDIGSRFAAGCLKYSLHTVRAHKVLCFYFRSILLSTLSISLFIDFSDFI